jgi:phytol kinase
MEIAHVIVGMSMNEQAEAATTIKSIKRRYSTKVKTSNFNFGQIAVSKPRIRSLGEAEIQTELFRKAIHFLIAAVPFLANINRTLTMFALAAGIVLYTLAEAMRLQGVEVPVISGITRSASRDRDRGRFVLGPVTLGFGAILALSLYPHPASAVGIYALAFGDGLSSLFGKLYGRIEIPFSGGKTFAGSFACFAAVFISSYLVLGNMMMSTILAASATILEAAPLKDLDNIILPAGTGLIASILLGLF